MEQRRNNFEKLLPALPAVIVLAFFILLINPVHSNDLWWHLQNGETIVQNGGLPAVDTYSHTALGKSRVLHDWLGGVLFFETLKWIGWNGIVLLKATLLALSLLIIALFIDRLKLSLLARLAVLVLGARLLLMRDLERPLVFSHCFFALTVVSLYAFRLKASRNILWLLPLMAVWCNLHGEYIQGIFFVGLFLAGETLEYILLPSERTSEKRGRLGQLALLFAGLLLTVGFCNAYGWRIFLYPAQYLNGAAAYSQSIITEWFSPDFHKDAFLPLYIFALMAAMLASKRPGNIVQPLIALVYLYLTLKHIRTVGYFALATMPVFAEHLDSAGERLLSLMRGVNSAFFRSASECLVGFFQRAAKVSDRAGFLPALLLAWCLICASSYFFSENMLVKKAFGIDNSNYPDRVVAWLKQNRPSGNMFNDYGWGGYLIRNLPEYPVFVDGRADLYGDEFLRLYRDVDLARGDWKKHLQRHDVRIIAVWTDRPIAHILREMKDEWREVLNEDREALFLKIDRR